MMNASSTAEPIHAPELAMDDLFPVGEEAKTRTARMRERIEEHRGARRAAKKAKREWGTVTPAVPPSFLFESKRQWNRLRSSCHVERGCATLPANDPACKRLPQKIRPVEAEATCP